MITYLPHRRKGFQADPFSPLDLSPALWLDASDAATITATGSAVDAWNDKSGAARHFTGSGAFRPSTGTRTQNSLNVVDFAAAHYLTRSGALGFSGNPAIFVAATVIFDDTSTGYPTPPCILGLGPDPAPGGTMVSFHGDGFRFNGGNEVFAPPTDGTASAAFWHRPASGNYAAGQYWTANVEKTATGSSNPTNTYSLGGTAFSLLGAHQHASLTGAANWYKANLAIGELIVSASLPTSGQRAALYAYLAAKWGV